MGIVDTTSFANVGQSVTEEWAAGRLPRNHTGKPLRLTTRVRPRERAALMPTKGVYDPPENGLLAGLNPDQMENLMPRAMSADLKSDG